MCKVDKTIARAEITRQVKTDIIINLLTEVESAETRKLSKES